MKRAIVLYIPVLHEGYLKFFEKHRDATKIYLLSEDIVGEFMPLHKEIRAINPEIMAKFVAALGWFDSVEVVRPDTIGSLKDYELITADESVSRRFAEKYLNNVLLAFDKVFLRWDEKSVYSMSPPENVAVSTDDFDRQMMAKAGLLGYKSSDWWRGVGAVVVKDGRVVLTAHNEHVPSEYLPYVEGDPRDFIKAGESPEFSTALHSEQAVIAEAARQGLSFDGASIYVTVFPCPVCAKLIAYSGIKKCFFSSGHASLDGERVLRSKGVAMVFVKN